MPYIKKEDREKLLIKHGIDLYDVALVFNKLETAGELQFAMAAMFQFYIRNKGLNYQTCNDIMGALSGAQMEFYRRTVAPYEDEKIKENSDVYTPKLF